MAKIYIVRKPDGSRVRLSEEEYLAAKSSAVKQPSPSSGRGLSPQELALSGLKTGLSTALDPRASIQAQEAIQRRPDILPVALGTAGGIAGSRVPFPFASTLLAGGGAGLGQLLSEGIKSSRGMPGAPAGVGEALARAGTSGALGMTGEAAGAAPGAIVRGIKSILPSLLVKTAKVQPLATETLLERPELLMKARGSEKVIEAGVEKVQNALVKAKDRVSFIRNKVLDKLGISKSLKGIEDDLLKERGKLYFDAGEIPDLFTQAKRMEVPKEKLAYLLKLRQSADDNIKFSNTRVRPLGSAMEGRLRQLARQINEEISRTPGGGKVRMVDKATSRVLENYETLQKDLAQPGAAQAKLERLFRQGSTSSILVKNKDMMKALRQLERLSKEKLIDPLFDEFTAAAFKPRLPLGGAPLLASLLATSLGTLGGQALAGGDARRSLAPLGALGAVGILASPRLLGKTISGAVRTGRLLSPAQRALARQGLRLGGQAGAQSLSEGR